METPKPGPEQDALRIFSGDWRGEETWHPTQWMPEGGRREGRFANRMGLHGFGAIMDYEQFVEGAKSFAAHAVIMKNPTADGYQMFWFDSYAASVFNGAFDGERAEFVHDSPMGLNRIIYDFSRKGAYGFSMALSQDGGKNWAPIVDATYAKS